MENAIKVLSENLGMETVLSAVIVCVLMMIVKKIKPKISPRQELVIRFLISMGVHLLFLLITKGEYSQIFQNSMSVCGVSMILCALISKNAKKEQVEEMMSTFLPSLSEEECKEIADVLNKECSKTAQSLPMTNYDGETKDRQSISD